MQLYLDHDVRIYISDQRPEGSGWVLCCWLHADQVDRVHPATKTVFYDETVRRTHCGVDETRARVDYVTVIEQTVDNSY